MQIFLWTLATMIAFAANSVLTRMALVEGAIDPISFATVRLLSGAVVLAGLVMWRGKGVHFGGSVRVWGVGSLLLYIYGFSIAYLALDAGLGALILFGVVQITMFFAAITEGEKLPVRRWIGAGLAFGGLVWLLWPQGTVESSQNFPLGPVLAMIAAGVGWGLYSLVGRSAKDASQETAMNFLLAAPFGVVLWVLLPTGLITPRGMALAVLSGAVTSGLGYTLWYAILPKLGATRAAVAQLSVPVIAMAGGLVFLAEMPQERIFWASFLVLGGVFIAAFPNLNRSRQSNDLF